MAWVAVDSLNRELIFRNEPFRDIDTDYLEQLISMFLRGYQNI